MFQTDDIEGLNDFIEKEMHNVRKFALGKLASVVAPSYIENFASVVAYSWFDSHPAAEKIANDLDLCKLDFLAIQEELEAFKEEYFAESQYAENF